MKRMQSVEGPVLCVVMDGVGCGAQDEGDAVWLARTSTLDVLKERAKSNPSHVLYTELAAHGKAVGMPSDEDMGNSEVGHNTMGGGRVFAQGAKRVNAAIRSGELFEGKVWNKLITQVQGSKEPIHFLGLLSDGNVHSHIAHLLKMIENCHQRDVQSVRVHVLLDGRDVPETSALEFANVLEHTLEKCRLDHKRDYWVASGGGRMKITMDRYEADWSMVERGWKIHVKGEGRAFRNLKDAIETLRKEHSGIIDQNLPGFVIVDDDGKPRGPIRDGASVVMFNFRGDRAIEISRAFEEEQFSAFDRGPKPSIEFAGMMQYDGDLLIPKQYLVEPPAIDHTLGELLSSKNITQFACSETQKFGHVTYFWNGNRSGKFDEKLERYVEIPSDNISFEKKPWMKAEEITTATIEALESGSFRHARINYANGDMVGHTGDKDAAIVAVETVDKCLARLIPVIEKQKGAIIITADHGNADEMFERDKKTKQFLKNQDGSYKSKTSHTLNPVPCWIVTPNHHFHLNSKLQKPGLSNIAATILDLLGEDIPSEYENSLLSP